MEALHNSEVQIWYVTVTVRAYLWMLILENIQGALPWSNMGFFVICNKILQVNNLVR